MNETLKQVTGTSGVPLRDGGMRALIGAALTSLLVFVADKTDVLTDADIATLAPLVVAVAFVAVGVWDYVVKSSN